MKAGAQPRVSIVIPTWNRREDLLACLASVAAHDYEPVHVIVVDNASSDGSAEAVMAHHPGVDLLRLEANLGATGASNVGFDYALTHGADYVLRLDSDVVVAPTMLRTLVTYAEQTAGAGIFTGKIFYYTQPNIVWSVGAMQRGWAFGADNLGRGAPDAPAWAQPRRIDFAWSTAMLIRRTVLEQIGGFDRDFLVYYEEVDFCLRARQANFAIRFVPGALLWHKVGSSAGTEWTAFQWNRSKMLLYRKHSRGLHRAGLIGYAFGYALLSALRKQPGRGNRGPLAAALAGLWAGMRVPLQPGAQAALLGQPGVDEQSLQRSAP